MTSAESNTNKLPGTLARIFVKTLFAISALGCMAPSATINISHVMRHADSAQMWPVASASASGLSVLLAGLAPLSISYYIGAGRWGRAVACAIGFVACVAFNLATAIGVYSVSRADEVGAASTATQTASSLKTQIDEKLSALVPLNAATGGATAEMIKNEQDRMRVDRLWELSGECKSADGPKERAFCASYKGKSVAIKAAEKAVELEAAIADLRARMSSLPKDALSGKSADPQSSNLTVVLSAMGYDATLDGVGMYLNLLFAVVIEIIAAVGPIILSGIICLNHPQNTTNGGENGGPSQDVKHGPLTENSVMEAPGAAALAQVAQVAHGPDVGPPSKWPKRPKRRGGPRGGPQVAHKWPKVAHMRENNVLPFNKPVAHEVAHEVAQLVAQLVAQGKSQREISAATGVPRTTLQRMLKGRGKTSVKHSAVEAPIAEGQQDTQPTIVA